MDLVASSMEKVQSFRIKELKDVLTQLGLSKQGKKQDLVDRILGLLSDEQAIKMLVKKSAIGKEVVAKLVDDTYRKMQISGAPDLASEGQGVLESSSAKVRSDTEDASDSDRKVRCPCGNPMETEPIIQCEDPRCRVWQHKDCVIIPEKPLEGVPQDPDLFYCEICRLERADPFWVSVAHLLSPVKLVITNIPTDGPSPVQSVEKTFHLTRANKELLAKQEYEVQAWCMLLNDKVPFRMQWPQYADLQINGVPVRCINRPGSQSLGPNGRDDGSIITPCTKDGINKISLSGGDARIFCLGVRIVKRRTLQQILNLIPKESDGERFEDALARVRRCIGGGADTENADSDSDLEVVADSFGVNLRCPNSGSRMKVAGRFKPCVHMGCFDLEVFVELNQRSRKWQCPICLKNYTLEYLIIDPYFNRITSKMRHCGEDMTEIDVKPDGSWRVKTKTDFERKEVGELAQWHNPDSTPCVSNGGEITPNTESGKQIKVEDTSEAHTGTVLKLGIRNIGNGQLEVGKHDYMNTSSSGSRLQENLENLEQKVIPMSSSATVSARDGEDPSVNQDGGGNFEFMNNGAELESLSLHPDSLFELDQNFSVPVDDAEVIVLSDSDDENNVLISSGNAYINNPLDGGTTFSVPASQIADAFPEDPVTGAAVNSCFGHFNANDDEFGMPSWPLPPGSQAGPGFQFFTSDVSNTFTDMQPSPVNCPSFMNAYPLAPDTAPGSASLVPGSSVGRSAADMNDGLVDNPLVFDREDPSLQIFLPNGPSDGSVPSNLRNQADEPNGVHNEDWISLRLGDSQAGINSESVPVIGLNSMAQLPSSGTTPDNWTDTASLFLGINEGRSDKASRQRTESPFSIPRQKRSVRPRLVLSIDSDSE